jgi:hypothetical protein
MLHMDLPLQPLSAVCQLGTKHPRARTPHLEMLHMEQSARNPHLEMLDMELTLRATRVNLEEQSATKINRARHLLPPPRCL